MKKELFSKQALKHGKKETNERKKISEELRLGH